MTTFLKQLKSLLVDFIDQHPHKTAPASSVQLKANKMISLIREACDKGLAVHVIYQGKHATGIIQKYDKDKDKGQLILRHAKQKLAVLIPLTDIDKISLIPSSACPSNTSKSSRFV
ncbi:hypothetical protein ACVRW4_02845 [Streptococcus phocae subsp. phocae]